MIGGRSGNPYSLEGIGSMAALIEQRQDRWDSKELQYLTALGTWQQLYMLCEIKDMLAGGVFGKSVQVPTASEAA
jgi:hypothetical protein